MMISYNKRLSETSYNIRESHSSFYISCYRTSMHPLNPFTFKASVQVPKAELSIKISCTKCLP